MKKLLVSLKRLSFLVPRHFHQIPVECQDTILLEKVSCPEKATVQRCLTRQSVLYYLPPGQSPVVAGRRPEEGLITILWRPATLDQFVAGYDLWLSAGPGP